MRYPNNLSKEYSNKVNYGNRGMNLEDDLNATNDYYLLTDKAVIHKKPTPITIAKVDYKSREDAVIKEAYFKTPSTTDYNGIYKGKYIDFEAKETTNTKYFPLRNIHKHQIEHLRKIITHGGITFLIIRFSKLNQTYFIDGKKFIDFVDQKLRMSIPIEYIEKYGVLIKEKFNPRIDYLKVIDDMYFKGGSHETD